MNNLYFTAKNKKGLKDQSLSQKVYMPSANDGLRPYCIRHKVAGYHPSENEYISLSGEYLIKSQRNTPSVMIYECISRNRRVIHSMICQVCDLDKKSRIKMIRLFWSEWNIRHRRNKTRFAKANIEDRNLAKNVKRTWSLRYKSSFLVRVFITDLILRHSAEAVETYS